MMHTNSTTAIFLDLNGTLVDDSSGSVMVPVTIKSFYPGVMYSLQRLQMGSQLFIVTNQSGVGLGVVSKDDADKLNMGVMDVLEKYGVKITELFACRHARRDSCQCIKPNPYFLFKAQEKYGIDLSCSFVIGDHPHDMELAHNAGCKGLYVLTGHGKRHRNELKTPCTMFTDLQDATEYICKYQSEKTDNEG
ncbi:MAG TPA: HAD-IIIA family hydrolase [Chitinispirillaceae bacterium]|nr:HAD-IIIA family hydrolase [Chitinispirillaceae bacterium]